MTIPDALLTQAIPTADVLFITAGADLLHVLTFQTQSPTGTISAIDLTGITAVTAELWDKAGGTKLATFTGAIYGTPTNGQVSIGLTATQTAGLVAQSSPTDASTLAAMLQAMGRDSDAISQAITLFGPPSPVGVFDVQLTDGTSRVRPVRGNAYLFPKVTT